MLSSRLIVERIGGYFLLQHAVRTDRFGFRPLTWYSAFAAPHRFEATADTAPLAICKAALQIVDAAPASSPAEEGTQERLERARIHIAHVKGTLMPDSPMYSARDFARIIRAVECIEEENTRLQRRLAAAEQRAADAEARARTV